jgi:hypothetical protein
MITDVCGVITRSKYRDQGISMITEMRGVPLRPTNLRDPRRVMISEDREG